MRGEKLVLIDGPALAYRSYYAFIKNPLMTSEGEFTSVAFGFLRTLAKIAAEEKPDYWAAVFDTPAPTFRHEEFPEYKANRPPMPDDMKPQLARVDELLVAMRVPRLLKEGYEADDIMGTLAVKAAALGIDVILLSGDKDFCQLVGDRISVQVSGRGGSPDTLMDAAAVERKFGIPPEKIVDMLALMGDSSDNVPGVRGVGPKTAVKLLKEFDNLDALYSRLDEVKPVGLREKLKTGREEAFLSKKLVTLDLAAPFDLDLSHLKWRSPDREVVLRLLEKLEFSRMADMIVKEDRGGAQDEVEKREKDVGPAKDPGPPAVSLTDYLEGRFERGSDTTGKGGGPRGAPGASAPWIFVLNRGLDGRIGLAVCSRSGSPIYQEASGEEDLTEIKGFLEDERYLKVAYDLKNEAHIADSAGWTIRGVTSDVLLASYLLNPEGKHDLESLAERWLGVEPSLGLELAPEAALKTKAKTIRDLDRALSAEISAAGMNELLREVEVPLALVLQKMEAAGVALDIKALEDLSGRLEGEIKRSEEDIYCMAGLEFNINSPQQLSDVLFRHLGLKPKRKTKTGYSTDSAVLEELAADHELPREILNYRLHLKLKSTYVDALPKLVSPKTGRVHATFHQAVTATGRLSSSNPNLQNIPIRTDLGREIRKAFVPGRPGWILVAADYSQIELRIMAHLSGDKSLTESFLKNEDVHAATAAAVFGVALEEVDERLRSRAKMVNYGVMYGMGAAGLARRLGIKRDVASRFIEDYFANMPGVKTFLEALIESAREKGYATTILNRRRPLPAILSSDRRAMAFAERAAVNTPIQGSAADIIKKAMVLIEGLMVERGMAANLILQVHDELVFECPPDEVEALCGLVEDTMESAVELTVPLSVRMETGTNWCDIHR